MSMLLSHFVPAYPSPSGWLGFKTLGELVYCALPGYIFIYQVDKKPCTTNCLQNNSMPTQCMLGTLITPFLIHSLNESKHWTTSLKLFTQLTRGLPGGIPDGDAYFFGYTLLPWWGVAAHQHVLWNLSHTLTAIGNSTANSLTNLQKSLDSLAKVVLDNRLALDYLLAEQGGVHAVANTSCCTYINTSSQVETNIEKTRQQATWLQQTINHQSSLFNMGGEIENLFFSLFSWIP